MVCQLCVGILEVRNIYLIYWSDKDTLFTNKLYTILVTDTNNVLKVNFDNNVLSYHLNQFWSINHIFLMCTSTTMIRQLS